MRFTATSVSQFPSTPAASAFEAANVLAMDTVSVSRIDPRSGIKRGTARNPSGSTGVIIPGSHRLRINLKQLLFSWAGITVVGHFEIRTHGKESIFMYQSGNSGQVVLPCYDESLFLGMYGLRSLNNSQGGDYAITAFYEIMEI